MMGCHMSVSGLDFLTLSEAAKAIKSKELSPVDLARFSLEKISSLNPKLNAFMFLQVEIFWQIKVVLLNRICIPTTINWVKMFLLEDKWEQLK